MVMVHGPRRTFPLTTIANQVRTWPWRRSWQLIVPLACAFVWSWCLREVSPKDPLWGDEFLTRFLCTDRSLFSMLDAAADGVDGSPPAYWLLMWPWTRIAGASPLAMRAFTVFCVVVATTLTWITFRLRYGFCTASVVTAGAFFSAPVLWLHAFEARHYGLLVAGVAAMCFVGERLYDLDKPRTRWWVGNALVHALLVNTHLFGLFYSGSGLVASALADARRGRFRWPLFTSVALGWATLVPSVPLLARARRATEWGFWAPRPTVQALKSLEAFTQNMPLDRILLLVLAVAILALAVRSRRGGPMSEWTPAPIAGFLFVSLVPAVAWWLSAHGPISLWVDRYMAPQFLGWAALFALISNRLGADVLPDSASWKRASMNAPRVLGTLVVVGLMAGHAMSVAHLKPKRQVLPYDTGGLPVATEMSHRALEQWYYAPQVEIYYLLDEPSARRLGDYPAIDFKIMSALARHYPVRTMTADAFLEKFPRFLHVESGPSWLPEKLGHRYRLEPYGPSLTLVTRVEDPVP